MKNLLKVFIILIIMHCSAVSARAFVMFNVVVLPVDLFKVCANYYCYPEVSEIIAQDVIDNFNSTGRINSPSINAVRQRLAQDASVKNYTNSILTRYSKDRSLDFAAMKIISKAFNANSILIISNDVPIEGAYSKRNVWEMLVLSTDFKITHPYSMETTAVLVDTVNDLVMWNGSYTKKITDNNYMFRAPNASDAYAKLEYFKLYSRDILSKNISQNVYLRFFPKVVDPQPIVEDSKPEGAYFRFESDSDIPSLQNQLIQKQRAKYSDIPDFNSDGNYGDYDEY